MNYDKDGDLGSQGDGGVLGDFDMLNNIKFCLIRDSAAQN
jgi:hypothetical protein